MRTGDCGFSMTGLFLAVMLLVQSSVCAENIRVMNWNMANQPNDIQRLSELATIFGYVGLTGAFDVLAMAEIDGPSSLDVINVANSSYLTTSYVSALSNANSAGDRTGFVYNTSTLELIEATELNGGIMTQNILRGLFRPTGTNGGTDFYLYAVHLKSGTSGSDRLRRYHEAQFLRSDADSLGSAAVLFAGDFNWVSSTDVASGQTTSAYQAFNAPGEGQVFDPIDAIGLWRGNPAFMHLHTQNPQNTLDDRFDMQLASSELWDEVGLEYVPGSYAVVGNNGTHQMNQSIMTGTGAPPHVLEALANFSDHLPVIADYAFAPMTYTPQLTGSFVYHAGWTGADQSPWAAIDTAKVLVLGGDAPKTLGLNNLINTSHGLNGLVLDFDSLDELNDIDLEFTVSPRLSNVDDVPIELWEAAPPPQSTTLHAGAGHGGGDRLLVKWPNHTIENRYLRIKVLHESSLVADLYVGHLRGEANGSQGGYFSVSFADMSLIRQDIGQSVDASNPADIDKNGLVSFADIVAARADVGAQLSQITISTKP